MLYEIILWCDYRYYYVLILIFLEYALRGSQRYIPVSNESSVLILIFLEYALRGMQVPDDKIYFKGLNPYFFGICSTRIHTK